ncbi:hypothetical protein EEAAV_26560 (plasmid) [Rahnella aceris]
MSESERVFYFEMDGKIIHSPFIVSIDEIDGTVQYKKTIYCIPCHGEGKRGPYQCHICRGKGHKGHNIATGYTIKKLFEVNHSAARVAYRSMKEMIEFNKQREENRIKQDWVVWEHNNKTLLTAICKCDSENKFLKSLATQINQKKMLSIKQIEVAKKILEIN